MTHDNPSPHHDLHEVLHPDDPNVRGWIHYEVYTPAEAREADLGEHIDYEDPWPYVVKAVHWVEERETLVSGERDGWVCIGDGDDVIHLCRRLDEVRAIVSGPQDWEWPDRYDCDGNPVLWDGGGEA